jgi:uncharacterized membrane-anchored protein
MLKGISIKKLDWRLWLSWIMVCATGMAISLTLAIYLFSVITELFPASTDRVMPFIALPVIGLLLGLFQSFFLKQKKDRHEKLDTHHRTGVFDKHSGVVHF